MFRCRGFGRVLDDNGTDGAYHFSGLVMDIFGRSKAASARCKGGWAAGFTAPLSDGTEALEALFKEAAFGVDFLSTPTDEVGDAFFIFDKRTLVADGFGFEAEFLAFEETGDEFSDEFGRWWAAWKNIVNFDKIADRVNFFKKRRNDFVRNHTFWVDRAYCIDVDFL